MMSGVWSKGDNCLCPWAEDGQLYEGFIRRLVRHSDGRVFARVAFVGYKDEEEEVEICKLQKSSVLHIGTKKLTSTGGNKDGTGCLFRPLSGNEEDKRIKEKFSSLDYDQVKHTSSEVLRSETQSSGKKIRQPLLLEPVGCRTTKHRPRGQLTNQNARICDKGDNSDESGPEDSRKKLNHDNGEAEMTETPIDARAQDTLHPVLKEHAKPGTSDKEPHPYDKSFHQHTKDIVVKRADISRHSNQECGSNTNQSTSSETEVKRTIAAFSNDDLEKPRFGFPAACPKVPHVLSSGEPVYQIPAPLNQYLRDYQRAGVQFLYDNFSDNTGAILGDDMGLGKTVQVIGFLSALLRKQANREDVMRLKPKFIQELSDTSRMDDSSVHKPFLIIGPGSVLYNWLEELETWGHFTARKYHGTDKAQTLADVQRGRIEIVVTTYETYRDNVDDINSVNWCAVIVDEVHKIKGLNSQISVALRKIKTRRRFGLTGTALQNNLIELWAILDWARPGFLGSLSKFEAKFVKKIERGQKHDATKRELAEARQLKETFGEIRSQMMLRRTKKLIADQLPEKDDNIVFCKLTELQTDVYKAILTHPDMRLILTMREPCDCGSRRPKVKCCHEKTPDGTPVRHLMFTYMSLLMKAANHVALLIPDSKTSEAQKKHAKEICEIAFQNHPRFVKQAAEASFRTLSDPKYCGKMKVLCGLLSVFQKSHSKILLFSYSTKLLNIVEQYVISVGYEFRRIDGSVNSKRRMEIVHEFNNDDNIFICLISTKAGGLGLNLTGANVVIVFDPNWNPSYDLQAQDRAYRIGQRRNVRVFRLVSAGTIEENVYLRQVYKQQLDSVAVGMGNAKRYFHGIQGDKREKGELFGLKNMFLLRTGDNCLTMDILKRNENLEAGLKNFHIVEYVSPSGQGKQAREETNEEDLTTSEEAGSSENDSFMDIFLDSDNDDVQHEDEREEIVDKTVGQPAKALVSVTSIGKGKGPGKGKSTAVKGSAQPKQSFSSVSDVFDNCGVVHVHENPAVVGASRAEDHMTRCALQDVFELRLNSQAPAMHCEPLAESDSETESPKKKKKREPDYNHVHVRTVDDTRFLIGQTPKSIKRQQFQEISTFLGCASQIEFAEKVLSMSAMERVEMLNKFYQSQNPELPSMFSIETVASPENKASTPATGSGTKRLVSKSKGLHSQIQRPTRLIPKKVRKGLKYESSESMELSPPENLISQSDLHAASTSCGHSNLMDQSEKARHPPSRKKELSTGKSADNQSEKQRPFSDNQSESVLDEMILGNRSLPKRSPAPRKKTQTRIRVTKTTPQTWKCNEEDVSFPKTLCLDTWQGKNMVSTKSDSFHACESIQVDDLLDEMTVENNPRPDNRGSFKLKESSGDKFSVLDDIFMTKKYSVRRKPPPSTRNKQEHVATVAESVSTPCSTENSVNADLEDSTKDLFESLDVVHGDTLKTKRSLDVFRDSSKWKRRERKRYVPEKPDTMSEQVDKLIKRGKTEYENMFVSGKMRKLSREKPTQIDDHLDEPSPKDDGSGKDNLVNSQSLSLFSGQ